MNLARTRDRIFTENAVLQRNAAPLPADTESLLELSRRNPRTLYLEWLVVDRSSTLLFALADGEAKAYLLPAGSDEFERLAAEWRTALLMVGGRGVNVLPDRNTKPRAEADCARDLYAAAVGPAAALLESGAFDRLVALTDGPLLDTPLAALLTRTGKRLIDSFAISNAISLLSLVQAPEKRTAASAILVVSDPTERGKERVIAPSGYRFGSLQHARAEAESVAALFPHAISLAERQAREAQVKERLECCSILHFATHGVLDAEDGMNSGLLLAAESADSTEDGLLQAWEIAGMRLNAQLAVLSACDTARGDRRQGEGLMGLAWAFQAAGTPAVVASVWEVDDQATQELMVAFYTELHRGSRTDEALQKAMFHTREREAFHSPYYWAGFSLIGRASAIDR
jgi:CHAT domain-containing protein